MSLDLLGLQAWVYKWLSYTDESPIRYWEMELLVGPDMLDIRMATGHDIRKDSILVNELVRMESSKVAQLFQDWKSSQQDALASKIIWVQTLKNQENPFLLFTPWNLEDKGVIAHIRRICKRDHAAILAFMIHPSWGIPPTELYGPTERQHDTFNRIVTSLLKRERYFPQLEHGWKMSPKYYEKCK